MSYFCNTLHWNLNLYSLHMYKRMLHVHACVFPHVWVHMFVYAGACAQVHMYGDLRVTQVPSFMSI